MQKHAQYTRTRIRQLADRLASRIYPEWRPIGKILVNPPTGRIPYPEALALLFRPAQRGEQLWPD